MFLVNLVPFQSYMPRMYLILGNRWWTITSWIVFNHLLINHTYKNNDILRLDTPRFLFLSSRSCVRDEDERWHAKAACVGESCLSSWLSMQSFAASICQGPSLVATLRARSFCRALSLACSCSVIQTSASHFISPFSLPQRREQIRWGTRR